MADLLLKAWAREAVHKQHPVILEQRSITGMFRRKACDL